VIRALGSSLLFWIVLLTTLIATMYIGNVIVELGVRIILALQSVM